METYGKENLMMSTSGLQNELNLASLSFLVDSMFFKDRDGRD
jgi:hypothetical protein